MSELQPRLRYRKYGMRIIIYEPRVDVLHSVGCRVQAASRLNEDPRRDYGSVDFSDQSLTLLA